MAQRYDSSDGNHVATSLFPGFSHRAIHGVHIVICCIFKPFHVIVFCLKSWWVFAAILDAWWRCLSMRDEFVFVLVAQQDLIIHAVRAAPLTLFLSKPMFNMVGIPLLLLFRYSSWIWSKFANWNITYFCVCFRVFYLSLLGHIFISSHALVVLYQLRPYDGVNFHSTWLCPLDVRSRVGASCLNRRLSGKLFRLTISYDSWVQAIM